MEISDNYAMANNLEMSLQKERVNSQLYSDLANQVTGTNQKSHMADPSSTILQASYDPQNMGVAVLSDMGMSSFIENKGGIVNSMA